MYFCMCLYLVSYLVTTYNLMYKKYFYDYHYSTGKINFDTLYRFKQ